MAKNKASEFAKRLIQIRAEKGYSQKELADLIGIAASSISRYESGLHYPRFTTISILAHYLDVPFNWLAYGE